MAAAKTPNAVTIGLRPTLPRGSGFVKCYRDNYCDRSVTRTLPGNCHVSGADEMIVAEPDRCASACLRDPANSRANMHLSRNALHHKLTRQACGYSHSQRQGPVDGGIGLLGMTGPGIKNR